MPHSSRRTAADRPIFILASASPRRLALLNQIGFAPDRVVPAEIDETPMAAERPEAVALRLSREKARSVAARHQKSVILAADTVVACGRRILPKPQTESEAKNCLSLLSGRRHRVFGGVTVIGPDGTERSRTVRSVVSFKRLGRDEVSGYLASEEWRDKAGGYAIQGRAARFVRFMSGSYSNIVGLPLFESANLLAAAGLTPA